MARALLIWRSPELFGVFDNFDEAKAALLKEWAMGVWGAVALS